MHHAPDRRDTISLHSRGTTSSASGIFLSRFAVRFFLTVPRRSVRFGAALPHRTGPYDVTSDENRTAPSRAEGFSKNESPTNRTVQLSRQKDHTYGTALRSTWYQVPSGARYVSTNHSGRKYKHVLEINMKTKRSFYLRPEWYILYRFLRCTSWMFSNGAVRCGAVRFLPVFYLLPNRAASYDLKAHRTLQNFNIPTAPHRSTRFSTVKTRHAPQRRILEMEKPHSGSVLHC